MNDAAALIVDIAIAVTLVEVVVLLVVAKGRRPSVVANVGAGLALMLGMRAAVGGAHWLWIAASLLVAGACHAVDLASRRRP